MLQRLNRHRASRRPPAFLLIALSPALLLGAGCTPPGGSGDDDSTAATATPPATEVPIATATPAQGTPDATPTDATPDTTPTDATPAVTPTDATPGATEPPTTPVDGTPPPTPVEGTPAATPSPTPSETPSTGTFPILFVTQVPCDGYGTIGAPFSNHLGRVDYAPRGGDLFIRYPDGTLRNLTKEAGYGMDGMQGANAIAVRNPAVHWSGTKAVFSMAVGAPTKQYTYDVKYWQLYEITGLARGEKAVISKVANQPAYNNISPTYGSDDRIIFTSDRPRDGSTHLYPMLDEYESSPIVTGVWSLDPTSSDLRLLTHSPSGAFGPTVDSFGRVIFTKWDHLQRDQQADTPSAAATYKPVNYPDESSSAKVGPYVPESFPEQRTGTVGNVNPFTFNQFFPWQINEDGTSEETLNHVGRQELGGTYTDPLFNDDPNLSYYTSQSYHDNVNYMYSSAGLFYLREDPLTPGLYFAAYVQEFASAAAGQVVTLEGPPELNPEDMVLSYITAPSTFSYTESPDHSGHYRNPLPLSDGTVIVSHTEEIGNDVRTNTNNVLTYSYDFRLKPLIQQGPYQVAGDPLIPEGIVKSVSWYSPDVLYTYSGPLWELDAVEVRALPRPTKRKSVLEPPEQQILSQAGVDEAELRSWLQANDLALIVSRNVTQRDRADVQQPYNLRVPNGVSSTSKSGKVYDVAYMQIEQGDLLRAYQDKAGRRVYPQPMHDDKGMNIPLTGAPGGSVALATDGSMAAFVPARRALSWQLTDPKGVPTVIERNWITFQPGEIRTCAACHGINTQSQTGQSTPQNPPAALKSLLERWKTLPK